MYRYDLIRRLSLYDIGKDRMAWILALSDRFASSDTSSDVSDVTSKNIWHQNNETICSILSHNIFTFSTTTTGLFYKSHTKPDCVKLTVFNFLLKFVCCRSLVSQRCSRLREHTHSSHLPVMIRSLSWEISSFEMLHLYSNVETFPKYPTHE